MKRIGSRILSGYHSKGSLICNVYKISFCSGWPGGHFFEMTRYIMCRVEFHPEIKTHSWKIFLFSFLKFFEHAWRISNVIYDESCMFSIICLQIFKNIFDLRILCYELFKSLFSLLFSFFVILVERELFPDSFFFLGKIPLSF